MHDFFPRISNFSARSSFSGIHGARSTCHSGWREFTGSSFWISWGQARFIAKAHGSKLYDVDGNQYVDLVNSWGPMLLGNAHPEILAAVTEAMVDGLSFGAPTEAEIDLAEMIVDRTSVAKVRMVNSGTEATMSAVRLARGFTGRPKILKFEGCYHGHVDALLAAAGSGVATLRCRILLVLLVRPLPTLLSCPITISRLSNKRSPSMRADRCHYHRGCRGNMGTVAPHDNFNARLKDLCHSNGALLILDEVMTGFRTSYSGWYGVDNVAGDLTTFGKVISGGLPAAAFGGRADIMDHLAPVGPVYQAGTLSGNPIAMAAGKKSLELATEQIYDTIRAHADRLADLIHDALGAVGVRPPHSTCRHHAFRTIRRRGRP